MRELGVGFGGRAGELRYVLEFARRVGRWRAPLRGDGGGLALREVDVDVDDRRRLGRRASMWTSTIDDDLVVGRRRRLRRRRCRRRRRQRGLRRASVLASSGRRHWLCRASTLASSGIDDGFVGRRYRLR